MRAKSPAGKTKVVVIDALRTPFIKSFGAFENETALGLSNKVALEIINKTGINVGDIDSVVWGTVIPSVKNSNIARDIVIFSGLPKNIPAFTVSKACTSGMAAIQCGFTSILADRSQLILTGGVEVMSRVPLNFTEEGRKFFTKLARTKAAADKLNLAFKTFSFKYLLPEGVNLTESATGLTMGESAEIMAVKNNISRKEQDEFSLRSHNLAANAVAQGWIKDEIVPVVSSNSSDSYICLDNIVRVDASLADLTKLRPAFDRRYGTVTAGNSSALTDGASSVLLASESYAQKHNLPVLGYIIDVINVAVDPNEQLLIGPAHAIPKLLQRNGLAIKDVEIFEIHEAFAAQVLSCLKVLNDEDYCKKHLNLTAAYGEIPISCVNRDGGSLAYGHPLAATGGRLVARALRLARRLGKKYAVIAVCAAGGQAEAMLLEV